jgi:hypothetical protein
MDQLDVVQEPTSEGKPETVPCENPEPKRVTIAGIEVDSVGSIDPDRIAKVTSGRRQIPLSLMFRHGGLDSAQSAGLDHFIAVVCYDILSESSIKISNLNFTGSVEAILNIGDTTDVPVESFRNTGLLILNPTPTGPTSLRIPSSRGCLRLGSLSGIGKCSHDGCSKPVLIDRDGPLCYQHAVAAGIRITTGGTSVTFDNTLSVEDEEKRKRERQAIAPSAAEKEARDREMKRQELIAKKKTALMLLNRNFGGGKMEVNARLSTGSLREDLIDIGEVVVGNDDEKLKRLNELKRKRATLDRKVQRMKKKENEAANVALSIETKEVVGKSENRKSLSEQLAYQIKSERGF